MCVCVYELEREREECRFIAAVGTIIMVNSTIMSSNDEKMFSVGAVMLFFFDRSF